jgi:lipoprotein-releasing system permease protein
MINTISSFISWRYLWHKEKDSNIAVMLKICFAGITIGTFALMLTLIITNGFEKVIHEKMRGINAQAVIYSPGNKLDFDGISNALTTEFKDSVKGISSNCFKQVIVDDQESQSVLFLKAIEPDKENSVTTLAEKVITYDPAIKKDSPALLLQLLKSNNIIIGYKMAQDHHLSIGQDLDIMIPEPQSKKKLALKKHTFTVAGIFKIGLEEYDNNVAFLSQETFNDLYNEKGVDQITLKLKSYDDSFEQLTIQKLQKRLPHLTVRSWKDMYPALVASLKLEKYVMFFVLALITLVACMNMISLLFMQIQHKRRDIAIFKAMGMANKHIRSIFLQMGIVVTMSASLIGLALAAIAGYLIERYPFIELPDVYYISYLPARMDTEIFIVVFVATLLLGFLATWIPAKRSTQINIANVLRQ